MGKIHTRLLVQVQPTSVKLILCHFPFVFKENILICITPPPPITCVLDVNMYVCVLNCGSLATGRLSGTVVTHGAQRE